MSFMWWVIVGIGMLVAGYAWGRRRGVQEGIKLGRSLAPLELRQQSLERGYCLLCRQTPTARVVYHSALLML